MTSLRSLLAALTLLATTLPFAEAGKGTKKPIKTEPTEGGEPWVAGHTLTQWTEIFRTGNPEVRKRAADMIAWCCTQKKSTGAAKVMVEVLEDPITRLTACEALGRMQYEGGVAVLALVPRASARERSRETRCAALKALGSIGLTRPGVLDVLIEGLNDGDDAVRRTAGYAIYRIGPDARPIVPKLIEALKDPAPVVAESAAIALSGIREDARDAAPALIEALKYPNHLVRRHVTEALQRLCSADPAVHRALVAGLKDEHPEVSSGCVWAIHFCKDIGPEVVDGLCWALTHGSESMRYYAANAMSELAIDAPKTMAPLIRALDDQKTRAVAATALGKRRPVTEKTLAALMAAFEKGHYERIAIANALAEMGPAAESTTRRLKEGLKEHVREGTWSHELVHVALANALWKINKDRDMIPVLAKLANYPYDHHVTNGACAALGEIGPEAKEAVPALIEALKGPREDWSAARALMHIGAPEGEKALYDMLSAPKRDRKLHAARAARGGREPVLACGGAGGDQEN